MSYSTCPSCGLEKELLLCNECDYSEEQLTQHYRELLNKATETKAGFNAYMDKGCFTCKPCKDVWKDSSFYCPTRMFYADSMLLSLLYHYDKNKEKGFPQSLKEGIFEIQSFLWTQSKESSLVYRKRLYNNFMERFINKIKEDESLVEIKKLIFDNGRPKQIFS